MFIFKSIFLLNAIRVGKICNRYIQSVKNRDTYKNNSNDFPYSRYNCPINALEANEILWMFTTKKNKKE